MIYTDSLIYMHLQCRLATGSAVVSLNGISRIALVRWSDVPLPSITELVGGRSLFSGMIADSK